MTQVWKHLETWKQHSTDTVLPEHTVEIEAQPLLWGWQDRQFPKRGEALLLFVLAWALAYYMFFFSSSIYMNLSCIEAACKTLSAAWSVRLVSGCSSGTRFPALTQQKWKLCTLRTNDLKWPQQKLLVRCKLTWYWCDFDLIRFSSPAALKLADVFCIIL